MEGMAYLEEIPYNILVVDADFTVEPLVRHRMRKYIQSGQYSYSFANSIEQAVRLLGEGDFDVLVDGVGISDMGVSVVPFEKPIDWELLQLAIEKAIEQARLESGVARVFERMARGS